MSQTKRGPNGETIGIDGPEELFPPPDDENYESCVPHSDWRRWWAATEGIRWIAAPVLLAIIGFVLMILIAG